jgi:23S rRNA (adenine2503-C2)-methyltransferase
MELIHESGQEDLASVYVARFRMDDRYLAEFVDSMSKSPSRQQKWVAILSSQYGCPVGCLFCDAGDHFHGDLTKAELLAQLDFLVEKHYPDRRIPTAKFKVQFARMGEPAFNPDVVDAIREMRTRYDAPGLIPCLSTVAPRRCGDFFERLLRVRNEQFPGEFQLQFSVHSTDEATRDSLIPCPKWSLDEISDYGNRFHGGRGRKVVLNFALSKNPSIDPKIIQRAFDPAHFMVKLTPVNPTQNARMHGLESPMAPGFEEGSHPVIRCLREHGFATVVSVGDLEENSLGSNCGQVLALWKDTRQ